MNYPVPLGRGIPFGASSFSGFHPRPAKAEQGIPATKIKVRVPRSSEAQRAKEAYPRSPLSLKLQMGKPIPESGYLKFLLYGKEGIMKED